MTDETLTRLDWNPSDSEMEAYLKREVELAKQNIALLKSRGYSVDGNTLHSQYVVLRAMASSSS